jgi:hypothetical protein
MSNMRLIIFFVAISISSLGQKLTQSFSGTVKDAWSQKPVSLANISLYADGNLVLGSVTDSTGHFLINEIELGRYRLVVSYTGYQSFESELLIISGKTQRMDIQLQESKTMLEEVVISPSSISTPNATTIPIEKALRVPANFFDPVRMLTSYPGVVTANDQSNAIVVKGYSPNAIGWRLQGLDILNPNHLANAGTFSDKPVANGGGVNVLSAQLLDRTNFYSGSLPVQYGNALSGIMDMTLRSGNTDKVQYTAQASLIGLDVAAEGPIDKKKKSSFVANYRYSTVGLLSQMGIDFGGEQINFQDFSFNLNVPGNGGGNLSLFGFGGLSANKFSAKEESEWEVEKDRYTIDFTGNVYGVGIVNQFKPGWASVSVGASFSGQNQERKSQGTPVPYPNVYRESFNSNNNLASVYIKAVHKLSSSGSIESGVRLNYTSHSLDIESVNQLYINPFAPNISGKVEGLLWQPYINWAQNIGEFSLHAGVRYVNFTYNNSSVVEPRLNLSRNWKNNSFTLSYGLTSQIQQTQNYLRIDNNNLSFTKSNQFSAEWRKYYKNHLSIVSSIYYHQLFDVPVYAVNQFYSVINQFDDYPNEKMNNTGKGRNYGIELNVEKRYYGNMYFMISGSYYKSEYEVFDNYLSTRFDGNFTSSLLAGKEWISGNKSFGINGRVIYTGGLRLPQIDTYTSSVVGTTVFNYSQGFPVHLPNYFRSDLRINWRKNKPNYTRIIYIDIQNLTGYKNEANIYYDTFLQALKVRYQVGIIPVLGYRVDF